MKGAQISSVQHYVLHTQQAHVPALLRRILFEDINQVSGDKVAKHLEHKAALTFIWSCLSGHLIDSRANIHSSVTSLSGPLKKDSVLLNALLWLEATCLLCVWVH